jgi:hypothetical protein
MPHVLQPADFKIVQTAFRSLIDEDWFDRTAANERACTQLVLVLYGKGGLSAEELRAKCIDTAREIFSKPEKARLSPTSQESRH